MTDHQTDSDAIIDLATTAAHRATTGPKPIDPEALHSLLVPSGMEHVIVDLEKHLVGPRRATGTVAVHDAPSLVAYVAKHAEGSHTAIYADVDTSTIAAVLNGHGQTAHTEPTRTGWGDHRVVYTVRKSPEWRLWEHKNGTWLDQAAFAEHIEEGQEEIVSPTAGEMLDLAQTLQATTAVAFKSQQLLGNGQRQFLYEETVSATAGQQGTMKIPTKFALGVRLFDGVGDFYKVEARLQFRIRDRHLSLRYLLVRPQDVLRDAFNDVIETVETGSTLPAFRGVAPAPLA
jgi:uncharacterized protein YfdQ (DUF2303 family)